MMEKIAWISFAVLFVLLIVMWIVDKIDDALFKKKLEKYNYGEKKKDEAKDKLDTGDNRTDFDNSIDVLSKLNK